MLSLSCIIIITFSIAGNTAGEGISQTSDYIGMDVIPEIEVFAPRFLEEENDTHNMVQGMTVFGDKEGSTEQGYRNYRRSFATVSALIGEYAVYLIAGIVTMTFGAVALTRIIRGHHVHLAHQHKHSTIHEYYMWRKAYLDRIDQERLTRRT